MKASPPAAERDWGRQGLTVTSSTIFTIRMLRIIRRIHTRTMLNIGSWSQVGNARFLEVGGIESRLKMKQASRREAGAELCLEDCIEPSSGWAGLEAIITQWTRNPRCSQELDAKKKTKRPKHCVFFISKKKWYMLLIGIKANLRQPTWEY